MMILYYIANANNGLVVGTGNKVEDFGIGFFTKYGDGGVDLSPIADLLKSEVYQLGKYLGVPDPIIKAVPTDGLWGDSRSDEDQIGATYDQLEWSMNYCLANNISDINKIDQQSELSNEEKELLKLYLKKHLSTKHKLELPPVCYLDKDNK
jgi:NAD+ synthase